MKQDVIVNNTVYDGVSNVVLVDADDGDYIKFNETSGATAEDDDVTAGETYYADGEERTGTHECSPSSGDGNIDLSDLHIPWENVDNKPFYEGPVFETIDWDGDIVERENETIDLNGNSVTYYKVSDTYIPKDNIIHSVITCNGSEIFITNDDILLENENGTYLANIFVAVVSEDNDTLSGTISNTDVDAEFPSKGIYFSKFISNGENIITTSLRTQISGVKKYLDSKFISDDIMRTSEKGKAGGVATLDKDGKIPQEQLPVINIESGGSKFAKDIIFTEDLITTSEVGNVELTNGKAIIPAKDKSIVDVWNHIFCKDNNPVIKQPYVTLNTPNNKSYEVGTTVIPKFNAALNTGSYEFNDNTNVVLESWEITNNTTDVVLNVATGEFYSIVVDDDTNFIITATANHSAGIIPLTALGNTYDDGQIKAGSITKTSTAITGFRNSFYGTMNNKNDITSDIIRGLTPSGEGLSNGSSFDILIPVGAVRVIIAYPATLQDITSIKDENAMKAEISSAFTLHNIDVNDVIGANPISYKVYILDYGMVNDTENVYKVVI